MVDHFHEKVCNKIGGQARAMVVTNGVERAIQYFHAIKSILSERRSPYAAIVAFSDKTIDAEKMTESALNGFPAAEIEDTFADDKQNFRFLICADKFQTGFDEPLLQTMYVDKTLAGVQAVQTLSRLNRAHPNKHEVFVLDFVNETDAIQASFAPFYRTTVLSGETDPNRLYDLQRDVEAADLFTEDEVAAVVTAFLTDRPRNELDPLIDAVSARYDNLEDDDKIAFKATAKDYVRTYDFLAAVLPYINANLERLSIMLTLLLPRLRSPQSDDLTAGLLDTVDLDSYRIEKQSETNIPLPDADGGLSRFLEPSAAPFRTQAWNGSRRSFRRSTSAGARISRMPTAWLSTLSTKSRPRSSKPALSETLWLTRRKMPPRL